MDAAPPGGQSSHCSKHCGDLGGTMQTLSGTIPSGAAVSLSTLSGADIDPAKETWVVIHGWLQTPTDVTELAQQVAAQRPDAQVLMLDWSAAAAGDDAETLDATPAVGAWAAGALTDAGFPAGAVNVVGYSYGVYVATELAAAAPGGADVLVAIDPGYDAPNSAYDPATQANLSANSQYSLSFYADPTKGNVGVAQTADEAIAIRGSHHNGAYWVVESLWDTTDGANGGGGADKYFSLSRLLAHEPAAWLPNQYDAAGTNTSGLFDAALDTTPSGNTPTGIAAIIFTTAADDFTLYGQALNAHALDGADTVRGSASADSVFGDAGDDVLEGRGGDDILDGGAGVDSMDGGAGADSYVVDDVGDVVTEAANDGAIDLVTASVSYTLSDFLDNLTLVGGLAKSGTGNALANVLRGNGAANVLNGRGGADEMRGGGGNDLYFVDNAGDLIIEAAGAGADTVSASVTHVLVSNVENLVLTGPHAINGSGNGLANQITGNSGNNSLNGGGGSDILTGGAGRDSFLFRAPLGASNIDDITDYNVADDTIRLDDSVFTRIGPLGTLTTGLFRIGAAAADTTDRIIYNYNTGQLFYDADGVGGVSQTLFATLDAGLSLTTSEFAVI